MKLLNIIAISKHIKDPPVDCLSCDLWICKPCYNDLRQPWCHLCPAEYRDKYWLTTFEISEYETVCEGPSDFIRRLLEVI